MSVPALNVVKWEWIERERKRLDIYSKYIFIVLVQTITRVLLVLIAIPRDRYVRRVLPYGYYRTPLC